MSKLDVLLINAASGPAQYQGLADEFAAVEPPSLCALFATYLRRKGKSVEIMDMPAWGYTPAEAAKIALDEPPVLIALVVYGFQPSASTQNLTVAGAVAREIRNLNPRVPIIITGTHPAALPERTLREEAVSYVAGGEGPQTIDALVDCFKGDNDVTRVPDLYYRRSDFIMRTPGAGLLADLDEAMPGGAWDLLPMKKYRAHNWHSFEHIDARQPYASIHTSLGCPYKCLSGDTLVNTIHGLVSIKELADKYGDAGCPVYTYDQENKSLAISQARNIRLISKNSTMVRVHFEEGSYIDCTPDHQFLSFRWSGRAKRVIETPTEACHLVPGARLRAMRTETVGQGYKAVCVGRKWRKLRARMVMEFMMGRALSRKEQVHHCDHDRTNDVPENLQYFPSATEHLKAHGEVSKRMRENNPAKKMTPEWRENIGKAARGKIRSVANRLRYRASKLGEKNPNYKDGSRTGYTRLSDDEINHVVSHVEPLHGREDVYCMEVPGYGWFFANDVLVKNCTFCCINAPFGKSSYRMWSPKVVGDELELLVNEYGVRNVKFVDEMFVLNRAHVIGICDEIDRRGLQGHLNIWAYARVDTVRSEFLGRLRASGFKWLALGIESASKHVRDGVEKGRFDGERILDIVREIQSAGINVIGNYIFGLPDDTHDSMRETLALAIEANCEFANFYSAMAYPGSKLYGIAQEKGWKLPDAWSGYSQHSFDTEPLPTETLTGAQVLAFRDSAFRVYFTNPGYLDMVERKFGRAVVDHLGRMVAQPLPRKLLLGVDDAAPLVLDPERNLQQAG